MSHRSNQRLIKNALQVCHPIRPSFCPRPTSHAFVAIAVRLSRWPARAGASSGPGAHQEVRRLQFHCAAQRPPEVSRALRLQSRRHRCASPLKRQDLVFDHGSSDDTLFVCERRQGRSAYTAPDRCLWWTRWWSRRTSTTRDPKVRSSQRAHVREYGAYITLVLLLCAQSSNSCRRCTSATLATRSC